MAGSAETKAILRERLRERLDATGKSPHAVSKAIGANPGYVRDLLDPEKTSIPSAERMRLLAVELGTTSDYLTGLVGGNAQPLSEVSFREAPPRWNGPPESRIPVLGSGYCDDLIVRDEGREEVHVERVLLESDHVVRLIERPPALWNSPDAYAIYYHGSSMEPRFYQGEIGIVDPRRPPSPGDFVVAQLTERGSDEIVTVIVKQLERLAGGYYHFRQFNPPQSFRIERDRVKRLHRICSPTELLGG